MLIVLSKLIPSSQLSSSSSTPELPSSSNSDHFFISEKQKPLTSNCAKRTGNLRYPSEKKKLRSQEQAQIDIKNKFEGVWRLSDRDPGKNFLVSAALLEEIAKVLEFPVISLALGICLVANEPYFVDSLTLQSDKESENENLIYENPNSNGIDRRRRLSLWKRFKPAKKLNKDSRLKPMYDRNNNKNGSRDKTMIVHGGHRSESKNGLDINVGDIEPLLSPEDCNVTLKQLEGHEDDEVLKFFGWMRQNGKLKRNWTAYNVLLRVLGRREEWNEAEALIKEMIVESDCELSYQVFNTLIYSCCKKGLVDIATKWYHMMMENGVQPSVATFGMLMSLYQKFRSLKEAESAFSHMKSLKIACQSAYSSMITMYTRMGLYDKAEEVIGFLREDSIVLNLENWLVMLNAYSQRGKMHEAEQVLALMHEAGFSPNIVAYNTLITGYGKASNMDAAQNLFRSLEKIGLLPDETTYRSMIEGWGRVGNYKEVEWYHVQLKRLGFKPNSSNLYTVLNLQIQNEDEEGAMNTIADMLMIGCQKPSILGILVQQYEKTGFVGRLPLVLKGSLYDHVLKNQTSCSILVMAYVKNGLVDESLDVLRDKQWEDQVFEDNLYHLLICSCKDSGHFDDAIKLFTCMPDPNEPNLHITCTMIDIYCTLSLFSEAESLYLKLKDGGVRLDMIAYSIVVRMYIKSDSLGKACTVLDEMNEHKDIVPDVFLVRDMLRIYQRCGMFEKLSELYYKILKSGMDWDQEMYNCVINCCARALPVDELSRLFDEMLERGFAPNTITFNVMLDVYGKSRLFKKARKVFWMARKRGMADVISYNTIIAAYGQSKDFKNMLSTVRKMQFDGFSVSLEAYNCMLDSYGKDSQMEKFRYVLQRMKESSCASDHYTYNTMINIYGEQGWIDEVADVLIEMKESGTGPDLCSYNTLIKAYGIAGMVEEAVSLVKEMRQNGIEPDQITYINLINTLRKNDKFLEAVKWSLWTKQIGL